MTDQRRFNDKEVALILKRAADLSQAKTAGGMTADELERIALEAGLDPQAVRQAALEVRRGETTGGAGQALLGGPTSLRYDFELDGELSAEHHEALLAVVQRNLDVAGTLNVAGRTFSWHAKGPNRSLVVQVSPSRGKTVVHIEERLGGLIGGIYGGVGGGVGGSLIPFAGFAGAALLGPVGVMLAITAGVLGTYAGTRAIYGSVAKRRKRSLDELADDLRRTLEEVLPRHDAVLDEALDTALDSALEEARERQGLGAAPAARAEEQAEPSRATVPERARRR